MSRRQVPQRGSAANRLQSVRLVEVAVLTDRDDRVCLDRRQSAPVEFFWLDFLTVCLQQWVCCHKFCGINGGRKVIIFDVCVCVCVSVLGGGKKG